MRNTALTVFASITTLLSANLRGQFVQPVRASEIVGRAVKDSSGHKIGTIKDLAVDLEHGRIVEVILATGGFLGMDDKYLPALPQNFVSADGAKGITVNFDRKKLEGAPPVSLDQWQQATEEPRLELAYKYYGAAPYFLEERQHLGNVESTVRLFGCATDNSLGREFGRVKDIFVDIPHGRVVEVILDTARYLAIPKELTPLPPELLHFDAGRGVLVLNAGREQMFAAPNFPADAWPPLDREQAANVYEAWQVQPYFLHAEATHPVAQTVPTVNNPDLTRTPGQGVKGADDDITRQITKGLLDSPDVAADARAVQVTTLNGHVTLRGTVVSEREKRLVGEIAARIVPVEKIDNQLQVRQNSVL